MAFFASLALIPFTFAFGAVLGYVEQWTSPDSHDDVQQVIVQLDDGHSRPRPGQRRRRSPTCGRSWTRPTAAWPSPVSCSACRLASRVFLPAVHALDLAYGMVEEWSALRRRAISVLLAVASLFVIVLQVLIQVFGPLLAMPVSWRTSSASATRSPCCGRSAGGRCWPSWSRLPTRDLPVRTARRLGWRRSLPGAIIAVLVWIIVAAGPAPTWPPAASWRRSDHGGEPPRPYPP